MNHKSIVDLDVDELKRVMQVNVRGVALGIKHAARVMIPRGGGGCIISRTSVAPRAYTASMHAIVGLTKNTACELGRYGIRVNSISPLVFHELIEQCMNSGSPGSADMAALYLASGEAKYVSGHNLVLDGGFSN
ncbi:hypothetical protein Golax_022937 [Gossypium laxum]|uniref:Uncharacterized protein n=1 Tax=Gossypium laxum TaxID=34288 RepID=A0A7J9B514_9ROSI|nr:hypothetical protein [Gossypium laxum]